MFTYATTFSGIGGWELGLNACGWDLKWQCEREPYCRELLKDRFGVPIYDDIRTICEHNPAPVDALIGSPPCQPFSQAGDLLGVSDERHLYPAFIDLVRFLKPRWVLMENVAGLLSDRRAFGHYVGGLAALGFDCVWHSIPASAVGAPHRRDRVWIIANTRRIARCIRQGGINGRDIVSKQDGNRGTEVRGEDWKLAAMVPGVYTGTPADWWRAQSRVDRSVNGLPNRAHRLKGVGNAVIPQIPYIIGQAINQIESGK